MAERLYRIESLLADLTGQTEGQLGESRRSVSVSHRRPVHQPADR